MCGGLIQSSGIEVMFYFALQCQEVIGSGMLKVVP
jgi:hypothetical protein